MEKSKIDQLKLNLDTDYDKLKDKVELNILRSSTTIEQYPDILSLMLNNKAAIKSQKKKDYYKNKYRK